MDTEGGGWTEYTTYGPGFQKTTGEVMFDIEDWKKEQGFDEWFVEADNTKLWFVPSNNPNTWRSHGINLFYHNFIIGDKAYHADSYNFPEDGIHGAQYRMDVDKKWYQTELTSYKSGLKVTFASYPKTAVTFLKSETKHCAYGGSQPLPIEEHCVHKAIFDFSHLQDSTILGISDVETIKAVYTGDNQFLYDIKIWGRKKVQPTGKGFKDCQAAFAANKRENGLYNIRGEWIECEQRLAGGGWTLLSHHMTDTYWVERSFYYLDYPAWALNAGFDQYLFVD